jgi:hypothetical protein
MPRIHAFLMEDIVSEFGEKVDNLSNAKKLSNEIAKATGGKVSYNSIRRIFGLIKTPQINYHIKTLNTLSRYCGFKNSVAHEKHNQNYKLWKLVNTISNSNKKIENFNILIKELETLVNKDPRFLVLIGLLTNKLILQENEDQLVQLYTIKIENIYAPGLLMVVTNCTNLMASSIRMYKFKSTNTIIALSKQETFIRLYLHHFIDYSINNQNYIELLQYTDDQTFNTTDTAYKYLFLDTFNFFKKKTLNFKGLETPYHHITNDFVKGRWIGISYLNNKKEFSFEKFYTSKSILLATEVLVFALICNDTATIKNICSFYENENLKYLHWYYKNEKIIIDLFLALNNFLNGNKKKASVRFHKIDITKDSNFQRLEHNTTLHLFIQIIIEGDSDILRMQFKNSKKHNHFKFLHIKKAIALNHSFSRQINTSILVS